MNMKKTLIAVSLIATLGLTSCGISFNSENTSTTEKTTEATTEEETTEETSEDATEDTTKKSRKDKEATTEASTEDTTEKTTDKEDTTKEDTTKASSSAADVKPVEGLSENYADLENRSFAYNGKVFTLGESTLQDLIDGGVPFKESDLNNKDNNVNKNHSTSYYNVDITDFSHLQVDFTNFTDGNLSEKECVLTTARWYSIYVPNSSYDDKRNADIEDDLAEAQTIIQFAFPITMKKSELLEKCPDGEADDYNNVDYKIDSTKYYGKSGYHFEFSDDSDQLEDVSISYLP